MNSSVFMRNYFNPMWISDLEDKTFIGVTGITQVS